MTLPIPMSSAPLLAGHRAAWTRDPLQFLTRERARHGDRFQLRLGPQTIIVVSDPPSVDAVLRRCASSFVKAPLLARFGAAFFGTSLTALDGEAWRTDRGALQKTLGGREGREPRAANVQAFGAEDDVVAALTHHFTSVLADWLLGVEPTAASEHAASIVRSLAALDAHIAGGVPWPSWLPFGLGRTGAMRRERAVQERIVGEWIARAPADSALRQALDAGDPKALLDNANIAIGLGAHQTALAAAWTLLELARHPEEQIVVAASHAAAERATLEALRLHPPFYALVRRATEDVALPSGPIARGTTVMVSPYLVHRDPASFEHADLFMPGRWASRPVGALPLGAFFPFGSGPRACIARHVLIPLVAGVVADLVRRYEVGRPPVSPSPRAGVVLGFSAPLRLALRARALPSASGAHAAAPQSTIGEPHVAAS